MKPSILLSVFLVLLTGCSATLPLELEPVKKATPIAPKFAQSYYFFDRDHTRYFIMRSDSIDGPTGKPITQIATIRVFWRPKGGVTTVNASALDATFRYILMTPDSIGMYEGAGFVLLDSPDGAKKFNARVADGDMRLTQASANFVDTLGRAHLRGYFSAQYNDAVALDMLLDAHREFFARSMNSRPAGSVTTPEDWGIPATRPAEGSATNPATMPAMTQP